MSSLSLFHPLIHEWFEKNIGSPSGIQEKAWPRIAKGEHVLITAPTGSGKTLASFLWAINSLVTGKPEPGTRILYISPLKALNNDIQKNLMGPLSGLRELFGQHNSFFPEISVMVRSGDTPESERRYMRLHPPEILITTPESLAIMLASLSAHAMFSGLKTVILDEIHAVAESKRGTLLASSIERLTLLAGEFQRIAASATVNPLHAVADFVGGYCLLQTTGGLVYRKRPVSIIEDTNYVKK
ncbi:MAG: DEAD/DEAH box helicase, partial [Spirochaetaceae bacterium]